MEGEVIVTTPGRLREILVEALGIALQAYQPPPVPPHQSTGGRIDFSGLCQEYYPGIPPSTVRQDTACLNRTKVGKRVLFERTEVEAHLLAKHQASPGELTEQAEASFTQHHRRRGGRKPA